MYLIYKKYFLREQFWKAIVWGSKFFEGANLKIHFSRKQLWKCIFWGSNFEKIKFLRVEVWKCIFWGSNFEKMYFWGEKFWKCFFEEAILKMAFLRKLIWNSTFLRKQFRKCINVLKCISEGAVLEV